MTQRGRKFLEGPTQCNSSVLFAWTLLGLVPALLGSDKAGIWQPWSNSAVLRKTMVPGVAENLVFSRQRKPDLKSQLFELRQMTSSASGD